MIDWNAISKARNLDIPADSVAEFGPVLDALEAAFRPLLKDLPHMVEPALILSESAVLGK